jgi:hypothetical protein
MSFCLLRLLIEAGEIEGGDAGTEREGGEGVPEIVDPAQRLDPGGTWCRLPLAVTEVVQVEVAAPLGWEEQRSRGFAAGGYLRARQPIGARAGGDNDLSA